MYILKVTLSNELFYIAFEKFSKPKIEAVTSDSLNFLPATL